MNDKAYGESNTPYQPYPELPNQKNAPVPLQQADGLKAPLFNKCGCLTLRTGSLTIGWLNIIFQIIGVAIISYMLQSQTLHKQLFENEDLDFLNEHEDLAVSIVTITLGITIGILILMILSNLFLIIGVMKKKVILLTVYLIINIIMLSLGFLGAMKNTVEGNFGVKTAIHRLGSLIYMVFCCLVVFCYQRQLKIELYRTPTYDATYIDQPPSYVA